MNLKFWKKEIEKDNIKIGIMYNSETRGLTDFCLICLFPGYHFNIQDANHFYIHKNCFCHFEYTGGGEGARGGLLLDFEDVDDVYKKNKHNIDQVTSLRKRYKEYIKE